MQYDCRHDQSQTGEVAVLFTDVVTESRNKNKEEFGEGRLVKVIQKNAKLPAQKMIEKILCEVDPRTQGMEP